MERVWLAGGRVRAIGSSLDSEEVGGFRMLLPDGEERSGQYSLDYQPQRDF